MHKNMKELIQARQSIFNNSLTSNVLIEGLLGNNLHVRIADLPKPEEIKPVTTLRGIKIYADSSASDLMMVSNKPRILPIRKKL